MQKLSGAMLKGNKQNPLPHFRLGSLILQLFKLITVVMRSTNSRRVERKYSPLEGVKILSK